MNVITIMAAGRAATTHHYAISICRVCGRATLTPRVGRVQRCACGGPFQAESTQEASLCSMLIRLISLNSDAYGDKLIALMERYNINSLREASLEMLMEYAGDSGYINLPALRPPN